MNDDPGWDRLTDALDLKFGITDHGRYQEPLPDRPELTRQVAFVCFARGDQHYRAERISGPAIVDQKSHYHRAAGSKVRFENIYDPSETSHRTAFYIKKGDDWQPIKPEDLSL